MSSPKPRVLLTNDDGPHDPKISPFVLGFYHHLVNLGWEVKVILPSSQKSWIGKAFHIKDIIQGNYFYPKEDGSGDVSPTSRPLKDGELCEWILLDGTPASCVNIGLHNLFPEEIDLVISGPNFGRNTSAALALSSGTVGAAMSSSLTKKRSIALSYGIFQYPVPPSYIEPAHKLACRIINHLWHNWGSDSSGLRYGEVDLCNVNIPMVQGLLADQTLKTCWTTLWRNSYGRLFENISTKPPQSRTVKLPGPDAPEASQTLADAPPESENQLLFKWSPDLVELIDPTIILPPVGSDAWAIHNGWASVTPLRAAFAESDCDNEGPVRELQLITNDPLNSTS